MPESPARHAAPSPRHVPPPWTVRGSAIVFLTNWHTCRGFVRYDASPVGAYHEWFEATLTRRGPTVTKMRVDSAASRRDGRANWGFPKELAPLDWQRRGARLTCRIGSATHRFRVTRWRVPLRAALWTVQVLSGRRVRVPVCVHGRVRGAWQGKRFALLLESFTLHVAPPQPFNK